MRAPLSEHSLVRADKVPRRLAENSAPAILDSAPEYSSRHAPPPPNCAASRSRSGGRETGDPSRTGHAAPVPPTTRRRRRKSADGRQDAVERSLIDDFATRDVNQDRVLLHQAQFAGTDQSLSGGRLCGADNEDI